MLNFEIHNPTKIVFGKDQLSKLVQYISNATDSKKILLAYGGGSAEKIGLLDKGGF
jgi:alcohol dehydrogenase YqhD (iron-dependent ADH family)